MFFLDKYQWQTLLGVQAPFTILTCEQHLCRWTGGSEPNCLPISWGNVLSLHMGWKNKQVRPAYFQKILYYYYCYTWETNLETFQFTRTTSLLNDLKYWHTCNFFSYFASCVVIDSLSSFQLQTHHAATPGSFVSFEMFNISMIYLPESLNTGHINHRTTL